MNALLEQSIHGLHASYLDGSRRPTDTLDACLSQIERTKTLGAFVRLDQAGARRDAEAADERAKQGTLRSPLDGVPIALKDNIITKGLETNAGSKILEGFVPPYDATLVTRLREAGAVIVGKTNLDEFAMGSSTEHSAYGATKNPWDPSRVPGGSSGGSAVAVAARQVYGSFGTDTGGSIRQPAAFCGISGIKPTYGRCSRWGIVAFASSLDQAGTFARTVEDNAIMLRSMSGHDPKDSTSAKIAVPDFTKALTGDIRGKTVGIPKEYRVDGMPAEIEKLWQQGIDWIHASGAKTVEVSLPHTKYALATYYVIAPAEASSNLARYDGVRYGLRIPSENLRETYEKTRAEGFGDEVKRRIMIGTYVLSAGYYDAYYIKAQKVRRLIVNDFMNAFEKCDVLLTPTAPSGPFAIGENDDDPIKMYLNDVFTVPASLAGLPGMSVPAGLDADSLPLGLQIIGRPWDEETVFKVAGVIESLAQFTHRPA